MLSIQIRKTDPTCPECGAGELLFLPSRNEYFERDLTGVLGERLKVFNSDPGWYRPILRRRRRRFRAEVDQLCADLRRDVLHIT